jgi:hypothetical protein
MAKIRVGVKRLEHGMEVEEPGQRGVEVFQMWIEIDGVRFLTEDTGLMECSYGIDREFGMGFITVRVPSHGFETVDHRVDPPSLIGDAFIRGASGE